MWSLGMASLTGYAENILVINWFYHKKEKISGACNWRGKVQGKRLDVK